METNLGRFYRLNRAEGHYLERVDLYQGVRARSKSSKNDPLRSNWNGRGPADQSGVGKS